MGALSPILRDVGGGGLAFWCPGCQEAHTVWVSGPRQVWQWNGDAERPVFSPSVLITCGHYMPGYDKPQCWCTYNKAQTDKGEEPSPFQCFRCHSFVGCNGAAPGQIVFLSDCTHALAGQTVDLPPLPAMRSREA